MVRVLVALRRSVGERKMGENCGGALGLVLVLSPEGWGDFYAQGYRPCASLLGQVWMMDCNLRLVRRCFIPVQKSACLVARRGDMGKTWLLVRPANHHFRMLPFARLRKAIKRS